MILDSDLGGICFSWVGLLVLVCVSACLFCAGLGLFFVLSCLLFCLFGGVGLCVCSYLKCSGFVVLLF